MVYSLDRWVGKVAVVTGSSAGIGASVAERLVKEGLKRSFPQYNKELARQIRTATLQMKRQKHLAACFRSIFKADKYKVKKKNKFRALEETDLRMPWVTPELQNTKKGLNIFMKVVALDRKLQRSNDLAKSLSSEKGKLYPIQADVTREEDILKAFKWTKENLGPIHILINNAGLVNTSVTLIGGKTEEFKDVFDTNALGLCIVTREAVQDMMANKVDGHIVHINSIVGHRVNNLMNLNIYPASKHAVTALTETLRLELVNLKSKIKVTSISPGVVKTELAIENIKDPVMLATFPFLETEDVTEAIVYILSTPPHVQVHELMIKPIGEVF